MKVPQNRVLVRVDLDQKNTMLIGDVKFTMATRYETNYREKSPIIAQVVDANDRLNNGEFLLCHHNHFHLPSPYHLYGDLYSIPANHTIFAILHPSGELTPVYGNVLASKVQVEIYLPLTAEYQTYHKDRGLIIDGGGTDFQTGDLVFTRPYAIYEIVYNMGGIEKRVCKINSEMICAVVKEKK